MDHDQSNHQESLEERKTDRRFHDRDNLTRFNLSILLGSVSIDGLSVHLIPHFAHAPEEHGRQKENCDGIKATIL